MRKKRLFLLGLLLCLLITSAMAEDSNAWFSSSAHTDMSLGAESFYLTLEDVVNETLVGEIPLVTGKNSFIIGQCDSKVDGLELSFVYQGPEDEGQTDPEGRMIFNIINVKPKNSPFIVPESPIHMDNADSVTFSVNTHVKGNTPKGNYKGQIVFTLSVEGEELELVLPLSLVVP